MPRMTIEERLRLRAAENTRVGLQRDSAALQGAAAGPLVRHGEHHCIAFVGNDSLGLASDPEWRAAVARCFALHAPSGRASRLAGGRSPLADEAEQAFADYFGFAESLFFPSGYQANLAAVTALLPRGHDAFVDIASMPASRAPCRWQARTSMPRPIMTSRVCAVALALCLPMRRNRLL